MMMPLVKFLRLSVLPVLQHIVISRMNRAIIVVYNVYKFLERPAKRLVTVDGESLNGTSVLDLETVRVSLLKIYCGLTLY